MIAVKEISDIVKGNIGQLSDQINTDMSCVDDIGGSLFCLDILSGNTVFSRYCVKNAVNRDIDGLIPEMNIRDSSAAKIN